MQLIARWTECEPAELRARLRALQGIARVFAGPHAELVAALRAAEDDAARLQACDAALARLPAIPRRRVLATFAATLPLPRSAATVADKESVQTLAEDGLPQSINFRLADGGLD